MTITAALLDSDDIYQSIDTLADERELTDRHLPQITACDLPAGQYRWIAEHNSENPFGGAFHSIVLLERQAAVQRAAAAAQARRALVPPFRKRGT